LISVYSSTLRLIYSTGCHQESVHVPPSDIKSRPWLPDGITYFPEKQDCKKDLIAIAEQNQTAVTVAPVMLQSPINISSKPEPRETSAVNTLGPVNPWELYTELATSEIKSKEAEHFTASFAQSTEVPPIAEMMGSLDLNGRSRSITDHRSRYFTQSSHNAAELYGSSVHPPPVEMPGTTPEPRFELPGSTNLTPSYGHYGGSAVYIAQNQGFDTQIPTQSNIHNPGVSPAVSSIYSERYARTK
jgi:hypothetical protein